MEDVILISSDSSTPPSPDKSSLILNNHDDLEDAPSLCIKTTPNSSFNVNDSDMDNSLYKPPFLNINAAVHTLSDSDVSDNEKVESNIEKIIHHEHDFEFEPPFDEQCVPKILSPKQVKQKKKSDKLQAKQQSLVDKAQNKLLKQAMSENIRSIKPGECLKYITASIDNQLILEPYSGNLLVALQSLPVQYNIQNQKTPCSITWLREVKEHGFDDNMKVTVSTKQQEESEMLIVWPSLQVADFVNSHQLSVQIQSILANNPQKKVTLLIYGFQDYFRNQKNAKQQRIRQQFSETNHTKRKNKDLDSIPRITKEQLEFALIELQILCNCHHRLVDSPVDLGNTVMEFTKAVAERPFKQERQRKMHDDIEWFAVGDSRDTVRVDKNGNGLLRLWKQQLCQLNNTSLDVAEAIASVYKSPKELIQAYDDCETQKDAELLLANIQIRRAIGPLSSVQRVGPELSRKLYTFFNSKFGETTLD